jgi:hypothetical protein
VAKSAALRSGGGGARARAAADPAVREDSTYLDRATFGVPAPRLSSEGVARTVVLRDGIGQDNAVILYIFAHTRLLGPRKPRPACASPPRPEHRQRPTQPARHGDARRTWRSSHRTGSEATQKTSRWPRHVAGASNRGCSVDHCTRGVISAPCSAKTRRIASSTHELSISARACRRV